MKKQISKKDIEYSLNRLSLWTRGASWHITKAPAHYRIESKEHPFVRIESKTKRDLLSRVDAFIDGVQFRMRLTGEIETN